jgi:CBS-domain-containing membrane protein
MFVAQIGCAAIGVLALSLFGPGWLARGAALSASIAFMTITGSSHPPGKPPNINISSGMFTGIYEYVVFNCVLPSSCLFVTCFFCYEMKQGKIV